MSKIVKNRDFSRADLRNAYGDDWTFWGCKFNRANLTHSTFEKTQFVNCSFNRVSWEYSNLAGAEFIKDNNWKDESAIDQYLELINDPRNVEIGWPVFNEEENLKVQPACTGILSSFYKSNLVAAVFAGYTLDDSDFSETDLTGASFSDTSLDHCSFKNIRFVREIATSSQEPENVLFGKNISLQFSDFSGTNLQGIHFGFCKSLEAANFERADLADATFQGSPDNPMSLYRACFDKVRLTNAVFDNCDLDSASFIGGDLRKISFLGNTRGRAANFTNSNLAGCQAKGINFTAANFSNSFIKIDTENEVAIQSSFNGAILTSTNFSDALLLGVNFDNAELSLSNFESATFTTKEKNNDPEEQGIHNYKLFSFNNTKLEKASFQSVNLNDHSFINCIADGAVFDNSELENVKFVNTSLGSCSFKDCYLPGVEFYPEPQPGEKRIRLSLDSVSFKDSNLDNAKFNYTSLINSEFSGSTLCNASFYDSEIMAADFKNTYLERSVFKNCNLNSVNFEQVFLSRAILTNVSMSAANFFRVHGDDVEIISSNDIENRAVVFRLHSLTGLFKFEIVGAIVEHGYFILNDESKMIWKDGFHCVGSRFTVNGDMTINRGLLENSKIDSTNCRNLHINSTTIRSSSIEGLNERCSLINTTLESCNLESGWNTSKFEEAKITLTNIFKEPFCGPDCEKLKLTNLRDFDKESISALKANAESLGHDKQYDHFFNLEKDKEIIDNKEKPLYCTVAIGFIVLFILFPAAPFFFEGFKTDSPSGYLIVFILLLVPSILLYQSKIIFLKWLYGHGHIPEKIFRSIAIIIASFWLSWVSCFFTKLIRCKHEMGPDVLFQLAKKGLHYSVNSFVAIGFWDNGVKGPEDILILYSNLEAMLGIVSMALLVVTIIRRTSGR